MAEEHVGVEFLCLQRYLRKTLKRQMLFKLTVWRSLKKLGIKPPYDPAIPLLGIYTEETQTEKDACTPMFTVAQFTIARTWKQPRCPLTDE